ncbi:MAG: argininosuccinate lyase [Deltaproteobacteria bacterium]|nr:argininosuccinate lyase [Deltaproteobacteria bacterium]MCB9489764.1 argininosuccinate lyase [Deltaproteobacteria bacterium]
MSLWKGRITGPMDASMERLNKSLPVDIRLLPQDAAVNRAWMAELVRLGILTDEEHDALDAELTNILREFEDHKFDPHALPDEDVHSLIERLLTERVGPAGAKIHSGRSRNDQVATDFRLFLRDACDEAAERVASLMTALLDVAECHVETVMVGYTHLQPALPMTLAFDLCSFASELARDRSRFADARRRLNECPLGSGSFAGSGVAVDRQVLATSLGFDRPTVNALDGVSSRDAALEYMTAAAICQTTLSRRAEDGIIRASREFGHHKLPDATSTGSSMMPQKRNPDGLELVRAKAATILGRTTGMLATLKGLPTAYGKDLQEDKAAAFEVHDALMLCLDVTATHFAGVTYNAEAMAASIPTECAATDFADALVRTGLPFRQAHERVAGLIEDAEKSGKRLEDYSPEELAEHLQLPIEECRWTPQKSISARAVVGGTAPEAVKAQIATLRGMISS